MKRKTLYTLLLFLTAMIWGAAFVAQSASVGLVEPFTFSGVRITMGGLVLLPVIRLMDRKQGRGRQPLLPIRTDRELLWGGILCGTAMCLGTNLQQLGIQTTSAGKCGFITALYVALVPVIATLLGRRRYGVLTWAGVALAVTGMYFLCMNESFTVARGDLMVFLCAVSFAVHILLIDRYTGRVDGVRLSCLQFLVNGAESLLLMLLFEHPSLSAILSAWLPICYAGILSCGMGYTLQVLAQKEVEPAAASVIMSLESVFSVLFGWLLLHERLSTRELLGCALVFCAVLLVELAPSRNNKKEKQL